MRLASAASRLRHGSHRLVAPFPCSATDLCSIAAAVRTSEELRAQTAAMQFNFTCVLKCPRSTVFLPGANLTACCMYTNTASFCSVWHSYSMLDNRAARESSSRSSIPRGIASGASWAKLGRSRSSASTSAAASAPIYLWLAHCDGHSLADGLRKFLLGLPLVGAATLLATPELRLWLRCLQPLIHHVTFLASHCARRHSRRNADREVQAGYRRAT